MGFEQLCRIAPRADKRSMPIQRNFVSQFADEGAYPSTSALFMPQRSCLHMRPRD